MNGLDKIIDKILNESAAECGEIINSAKAECDTIRQDYNKKAAELKDEIKASADGEINNIKENAKLKAETEGKKRFLNAQHELVLTIIEQAVKKLENLPKEEYFLLLIRLLERYSHSEEGEIVLSREDKDRITPEFRDMLEKHHLKISGDSAPDGGGFVLKYGEIEENCLFTALLDEKREAAQDKAYKILFG